MARGTGSQPDVSPDGRWLAYTSTQTDQRNVVVQALSSPGARTPVSAGGGADPVWSTDGRTLYYLRSVRDPPKTTVLAVDITAAASGLTAGTPRDLVSIPTSQGCTPRCFDVSDGPRFLVRDRSTVKRASVTRMDLVLNWTATLPKSR